MKRNLETYFVIGLAIDFILSFAAMYNNPIIGLCGILGTAASAAIFSRENEEDKK